MATTTITKSPPVEASLTFLKWQDLFAKEKPIQVLDAHKAASDQKAATITFHDSIELVEDVRGREPDFSIDVQGFEYYKHASKVKPDQFQDKNYVDAQYLPECEELLKERFDGVDKIHFLYWRTRKSINKDPTSPTGPARFVHVDQSPDHINQQIMKIYGDEADYLLRGRVRMINIWRPINGPIQNWPLAFCDATTNPESSLVPTDRVRGMTTGNTRYVVRTPGAKWYYQSESHDDEVVLFKCYDTDKSVATYCAHAAFPLPSATEDTPPRESIELRALVFTYPEEVEASVSTGTTRGYTPDRVEGAHWTGNA